MKLSSLSNKELLRLFRMNENDRGLLNEIVSRFEASILKRCKVNERAELTEKQAEFLNKLPYNKWEDVATNEFSFKRISDDWKPICKVRPFTIKGLEMRGYIIAEYNWKGARVKKIREQSDDK